MNDRIVIVGAGVAGYAAAKAALETNPNLRVTLVDDGGKSDGAYRDWLLKRDFDPLTHGAPLPAGMYAEPDGNMYIMGSSERVLLETNYPENAQIVFMPAGTLTQLIAARDTLPGLERIAGRAVGLARRGTAVTGVELANGEVLHASKVILCSGIDGRSTLGVPHEGSWPATDTQLKAKVRTWVRLPYRDGARGTVTKVQLFYTKKKFEYFSVVPFPNYLDVEGQIGDASEEDARDVTAKFVSSSARLVSLTTPSAEPVRSRLYARFGLSIPTAVPGLFVAGDALNLHSPIVLNSLYAAVQTAKLAGTMSAAGQGTEAEYTAGVQRIAIEVANDFDILKGTNDQMSATMAYYNAMTENWDRYVPPL